ncbi:major facilitator superfamily domain-containing protein [Aspergillus pseudodeflectus]|uniref:Major facilitator superfamily domain-containing protein n=1 Tax=Aspergillus pseudodeflectus TaxID=176178 RepID=A0ABR4KTT8_9EURO
MQFEITAQYDETRARLQEWDSDDDPGNPRNWSKARKIFATTVVCLIGFCTTINASMYSSGHEQVRERFNVSTTVSLLPLSAYSLGMAFGPMISSPLSETFGRKFVYLLTLPLVDVFTIGVGASQGIASLIVCRFIAGLFAAPGVSVAAATISDFTPPSERVIPLGIYYSVPTIGSAMGPLIGSFVVEQQGWRWTAWTPLIIAAALHPPALFIRESYKPILLRQRAEKLGAEGVLPVQTRTALQLFKEFLTSTIIRPLHMLFTEPLVGFICLYCGFQFALLYTFIVASPRVFASVYNFSPSAQGLSFLGMVAGCIIAPAILFTVDRTVRNNPTLRIRNNATENSATTPELRLYTAMFGSLVLPLGLFAFAWTARSSIHWMVPILAQGTAFLGSMLIYVPCNFYMLDVYGSKYGASASGASSLTRYALSTAFPLFVPQMYDALGVGWATSLLGFVAVAMAPIPWLFFYKGPRLRERSSYEHGT